ncbi:unnamed protein product [Rotaria sp. Silwood2]|nr:unnamed protein product [Rotaria sp. Silwood2]
MDNNQIEHLFTFTGENFYQRIQEHYGKNVEKILRFHDIDNYSILNKVSKNELLEIFEKPNDEYSTFELINLKKEVCNTFERTISLKIGTKNKMILLLKSASDIIKRKSQFASYTRSSQMDKYRSTSSSLSSRR